MWKTGSGGVGSSDNPDTTLDYHWINNFGTLVDLSSLFHGGSLSLNVAYQDDGGVSVWS